MTTAVSVLDGPEVYLRESKRNDLNFLKINETLDSDTPYVEELKTLRESFAKYKSEFLFLEAKQGVLTAVAHNKIPEVVQSNSNILDLEARVQDYKVKVAKVKESVKAMKDRIRAVIPTLVSKYERFQEVNNTLSDVYDKENSAPARDFIRQAVSLNKTTNQYGNSDENDMQMTDLHSCHAVLGNQTSALLDLQGKEAEVTKKAQELADIFAPLEKEIEELEKRMVAYEEEKKTRGERVQHENVQLVMRQKWYEAAITSISCLSSHHLVNENTIVYPGYVLKADDGSKCFKLNMAYHDNRSNNKLSTYIKDIRLEVGELPAGQKVTQQQVDNAPHVNEGLPDIMDIVQEALRMQDEEDEDANNQEENVQALAFLVAEVDARLSNWSPRLQALKALVSKSTQNIKITSLTHHSSPTLRLTLVGNQDGTANVNDYVVAHIRLSPDFPSHHACSPLLVSIEGSQACRHTQKYLDSIMDTLNADASNTMMMAYIEKLYSALY